MNHGPSRDIFKQKELFLEKFSDFIVHKYFLPFNNDTNAFNTWLKTNRPQALILKNSRGFKGKGIEKVKVSQKGEDYFLTT